MMSPSPLSARPAAPSGDAAALYGEKGTTQCYLMTTYCSDQRYGTIPSGGRRCARAGRTAGGRDGGRGGAAGGRGSGRAGQPAGRTAGGTTGGARGWGGGPTGHATPG